MYVTLLIHTILTLLYLCKMVTFCIGSAYFISLHMVERICPRIHMTRIHTEIQSSKVIKGYMYFYHMLAILISLKSIFFSIMVWCHWHSNKMSYRVIHILRLNFMTSNIACQTQYYFSFSSFIWNKTLLCPKDTMPRQIIWTTIHYIWKLHSQSINILKMHEHIKVT